MELPIIRCEKGPSKLFILVEVFQKVILKLLEKEIFVAFSMIFYKSYVDNCKLPNISIFSSQSPLQGSYGGSLKFGMSKNQDHQFVLTNSNNSYYVN